MTDERPAAPTLRCSFCGKARDQVELLIAGPTPEVAICSECIALCAEMLGAQARPEE